MFGYEITSAGLVKTHLSNKNNTMIDLKCGPPSTFVVPSHMAGQMQGNLPKIGSGDQVVTVNYNSIRFGPIYAKDEREVRHIFEFVNDKIKEYEFKKEIQVGKVFSPTAAVVQAKWALPSDTVEFIKKSFNKEEMKKSTVGRKRRSYPKRSEIIKLPKQSELTSSSTTPANASTNAPANTLANAPANSPTNAPTPATGVREGVMARAMARAKARKLAQPSASVSTPPTTPTLAFVPMLTEAPVTLEAASLTPSVQETVTPEIHPESTVTPTSTTLTTPPIDLSFDLLK